MLTRTRRKLLFFAVFASRGPLGVVAGSEVIWPELGDEVHVSNGCYISASAFLRRFLDANPALPASIETVVIPGAEKHSIVVVKEGTNTWARDEFIGVFKVNGDLQHSYEVALRRWLRNATRVEIAKQTSEKIPSTLEDRLAEVYRAQSLLPPEVGSEVIMIPTIRGQIPVLVWNPAPGRGAVYEPTVGTATADTTLTGIALARAALKRQGFPVV